MKSFVTVLCAATLASGCITFSFAKPKDAKSSSGISSYCKDDSPSWSADATVAERLEASLCSSAIAPGEVFASATYGDELSPAMAIVGCQHSQARDCSSPLGQTIMYDHAGRLTREALVDAMKAESIADDLSAAFADAYDAARATRLASKPDAEIATVYFEYAAARDAFWSDHDTSEAEAALSELASNRTDADALDAAIAQRDGLVRACMNDSEFSTKYCWHATLARPLTQAIREAAEEQERYDIAYLEHQMLARSGDLSTPSLALRLALESKTKELSSNGAVRPPSYIDNIGLNPWIARWPDAPPKFGDESGELFEKVVVSSAEVQRIVKAKEHATIIFKTRVSAHHSSGPCSDTGVVVLHQGKLKVARRCAPGTSTYETHKTAPVKVPIEDVASLAVGNRAYVVQAKKGAVGRLSFANPRASIHANEGPGANPAHIVRFTAVRPAKPGLP